MDWLFTLGGLHGGIFLVLAAVLLYTDHRGLNYFLGKEKTLPLSFVRWSHKVVWTGLVLMICTGLLLAIPAWEHRLAQPEFYIKMSFVLVLLMNAFAIGGLSKKASIIPFASLLPAEKITLLTSAGLSAAGWIGAAFIGFFIL